MGALRVDRDTLDDRSDLNKTSSIFKGAGLPLRKGTNEFASVQLTERVNEIWSARRQQRNIFPSAVLRYPNWDIMLLCFLASCEKQSLCIKQISTDIDQSHTALLRRIDELEQAGMVLRRRDGIDARRTLVELTADGLSRMRAFVLDCDESR